MTQKIICPECGAENLEDAEFCEVCQAPLKKDELSTFVDPQKSDQDDFLLNTDEGDLPGLLHALKHEDEDHATGDKMSEDEIPSLDSEDFFMPEVDKESEDIPDWLHRIRQRASEEDDSVGEITQKISSAKESLKGEKRSSQHESFESWIQKLRDPVGSIPKEESEKESLIEDEESEKVEPKESDWLHKIRHAEGKTDTIGSQSNLDEGDGSLLNWLAALEEKGEGEGEGEPVDETELEKEGEKFLDGSTQQIETDKSGVTQEIAVDGESLFKVIPPKLAVTPEEQIQIDKLASMIMDEVAPRPIRKLKRRSKLGAARFFFAILLIASIVISLFIGQEGITQSSSMQPNTEGFLSWAETITQGSSILLVFDYQPAFSSEINLMASPVLKMLSENESKFSVISSSISGSILYNQLFQQIPSLEPESIIDLGYYPIGAYAAFDLGMSYSANWTITGLPESSKRLPTDGFDGILILADTYDGARAWIEQLTILLPETPINLLVTDQAMMMLRPYFDSGQITGLVSGLNGAALMETAFSHSNHTAAYWWAYQIGLLLLMVVMVIGAIYAGNQHKEEGGEG